MTINRRFKEMRSEKRLATPSGLSLLELLIVLVILTATAVLVMPLMSSKVTAPNGESKTANEIVTQSTMAVIREAMVGEEGVLETMATSPDSLPREISELVKEDAPDHVRAQDPRLSQYNAFMGIGWRGPYLHSTGKNESGEPTVIDGWGREFELQIDFDSNGEVSEEESKYIRVVSAGPNGQIDTPFDQSNMKPGDNVDGSLTMEECGDDLVIFLCVPDTRR